ncbi:vWA-MoxR associated conflict system protein, partial [Streptomyces sp. NPDC003007]
TQLRHYSHETADLRPTSRNAVLKSGKTTTSQCRGAEELPGLEAAARRLHRALVDPDLGACLDRGEGETGSLLVGTSLGKTVVEKALATAVGRAKDDGGPLILALLGHGMGGCGGPLYFVTSGSTQDGAILQLDVPSAIGTVTNETGPSGLVAVIDTCHGAAALVSAQSATAGLQQGNLRLSLLFAASAHLPAWDMNLSVQLAELLENGVPNAGEFLAVDDQLIKELRSRIHTQEPGGFMFDGAPMSGESLWLANNVRAGVRRSAGSLGFLAYERLHKLLRPLEGTEGINGAGQLADWLGGLEAERLDRPAVRRVVEFKRDLRVCAVAVTVLEETFGDALTDDLLRKAAARAGFPLEMVVQLPCPSLRDMVEYAVLCQSAVAPAGQSRTLVHFVAALAHLISPRDVLPRQLTVWAAKSGVITALNSRLIELSGATPRLVLVAADDGSEDVVRVEASLLFGSAVVHTAEFPCEPGPVPGALVAALDEARLWALSWLGAAGERLVAVDVSVPTFLLLDSPPEEWRVARGRRMLGVDYDVTTRWSGLLTPPADVPLDDVLHAGSRLLSSLQSKAQSGPSWLGLDDLSSVERLQELLSRRRVGGCVWGVGALPEKDFDLMLEELLIHTPALIWPRQGSVCDAGALQDAVAEHWDSLPEKLLRAFQERLEGVPGHLADIRTTWHDAHWQDFCQRRAGRAVVAPQDVTPKEQA